MKTGRSRMLLLAALFIAPPLAATLLYFAFPQWIPSATTNYGQLVSPSRVMPSLALVDAGGAKAPPLGDKWSLVYLGAAHCEAACTERLYLTRQLRKSLDKDSLRVQRVYIAPDRAALVAAHDALAAEHRDLLMYADEGAPGARAGDFFQPAGAHAPDPQAPDPQAVYLVDPVGNWMMVYSDAQVAGGKLAPQGMFKDLKRLLRTSHIG